MTNLIALEIIADVHTLVSAESLSMVILEARLAYAVAVEDCKPDTMAMAQSIIDAAQAQAAIISK